MSIENIGDSASSNRFSPVVENVLLRSGWQPGRVVPDEQMQKWLITHWSYAIGPIASHWPYATGPAASTRVYSRIFPAAFSILKEFGGLNVDEKLIQGLYKESFCINPTELQESGQWDREWFVEEWILGTSLFPLGYGERPDYCIAVDVTGRVWGLGPGYHLLGTSFDEALENLILGKQPQEFEVPDQHNKQLQAFEIVGNILRQMSE